MPEASSVNVLENEGPHQSASQLTNTGIHAILWAVWERLGAESSKPSNCLRSVGDALHVSHILIDP